MLENQGGERTVSSEAYDRLLMEAGAFRASIRDVLWQVGVKSNPAFGNDEIVAAVARKLGAESRFPIIRDRFEQDFFPDEK